MKIVFSNKDIMVNDDHGGIARFNYEDAARLAVMLNDHFALKNKAQREADDARSGKA